MSRLRGAIVGFGNVAENGHWPGYRESSDFEIVSVVDPSAERCQAAQALKTDLHTYATVEELLQTETLDFVDICTPPASHASFATACLERGWHVLCEKPLALYSWDYEQLSTLAHQRRRTLFTVHNWKYAPIFQKAFQLLKEGRIGPVWHVELFVLRNSHCKGAAQGTTAPGTTAEDWRKNRQVAGGGILVDHGWHAFYLLLNLVQATPQRLVAKMHTDREDDNALEDAVQTIVQFPEADGYIHLTWKAKMRRNNVVVHGQNGTLLLDDDRLLVTTHDGKREEVVFDAALSAGSHHADWFKNLLPAFREEIKNPAARGQNAREAGWCVALTSAAYESNLRGFQEVPVHFPGTLKNQPLVIA